VWTADHINSAKSVVPKKKSVFPDVILLNTFFVSNHLDFFVIPEEEVLFSIRSLFRIFLPFSFLNFSESLLLVALLKALFVIAEGVLFSFRSLF